MKRLTLFTAIAVALVLLAVLLRMQSRGSPADQTRKRILDAPPGRSAAAPGVGVPRQSSANAQMRVPEEYSSSSRELRLQLVWWPERGAGAQLPSGVLELTPYGQRTIGPLEVVIVEGRGTVVLPEDPGPCRMLVVRHALSDEPSILIDSAFNVDRGRSLITLRVASEPHIVVLDSQTGAERTECYVSPAAPPPKGAYPRWGHPGPPRGGEEAVASPIPLSKLAGVPAPMIGSAGYTWASVPRELLDRGGILELGRAGSAVLHIEIPSELEAGSQTLEFTLAKPEGPAGGYEYAFRLDRAGLGPGSELWGPEGAVALDGLSPGQYFCMAVLRCQAHPTALPIYAEGRAEVDIRYGTDSEVTIGLRARRDPPRVEGWVVLPDPESTALLESLRFERLDGRVTELVSSAKPLRRDQRLRQEGPDSFHWAPEPFAPGRYIVVLEPLRIYAMFQVSATPESQSILLEIPEFIERDYLVVNETSSAPLELSHASWEAYGYGVPLDRPMVRMGIRRQEVGNPLRIRAPRGVQLRISASGPGDQGGSWVVEHGLGQPLELRLGSPSESVRVSLYSNGVPIQMPPEWWEGGVLASDPDGQGRSVRVQLPPDATNSSAPGTRTLWGWTRGARTGAQSATLRLSTGTSQISLPPVVAGGDRIAISRDDSTAELEVDIGSSPLAIQPPDGSPRLLHPPSFEAH